jgi:hypothetical protein
MTFKSKIITLSLALVIGLGVLSVGTCGHNRFAASGHPEFTARAQLAESSSDALRS